VTPSKEIDRLLEEHAVLVRDKNHLVFRLPGGQTFVRAKTPSDHRSERNSLADLKTSLGLSGPGRGAPGVRREKIVRPHVEAPRVKPNPAFRNGLILAGGIRATMAEQVSALLSEMRIAHAA
jgi:hypothetical protein